jgi:hypothetical protein
MTGGFDFHPPKDAAMIAADRLHPDPVSLVIDLPAGMHPLKGAGVRTSADGEPQAGSRPALLHAFFIKVFFAGEISDILTFFVHRGSRFQRSSWISPK